MMLLYKIVFFTYLVFAAPKVDLKGTALIKSVLTKYQNQAAIKSSVKKTVYQSLLDEKSVSEGELVISKGRLHLKTEGDSPNTLIMNKQNIWLITPGPNPEDRLQILKIKAPDFMRQNKAPLALFLGQAKAWDKMKVESEVTNKSKSKLKFVPITKGTLGEIVAVEVEVDRPQNDLSMIAFIDELENKTIFEIKKIEKLTKIDKELFSYVPPKNADITEFE